MAAMTAAVAQAAPPNSNITLNIKVVAPDGSLHASRGGQVGSFDHPSPDLAQSSDKAPPPTATAQATTHPQASPPIPLPPATPPPQLTHHFHSTAFAAQPAAPTQIPGSARPMFYGTPAYQPFSHSVPVPIAPTPPWYTAYSHADAARWAHVAQQEQYGQQLMERSRAERSRLEDLYPRPPPQFPPH